MVEVEQQDTQIKEDKNHMKNSNNESEKYDLTVCGIWIFSLALNFGIMYGVYRLVESLIK